MQQLRGRQVSREDFDRFDFMLAMDDDNLADLKRIRPRGLARASVALLMSYAPRRGAREVPDPYYGGADGFETVLDLVESAADGLHRAQRFRFERFRRLEDRFAESGFRACSTGRQRQKAHALPRRSIRRGHRRQNR